MALGLHPGVPGATRGQMPSSKFFLSPGVETAKKHTLQDKNSARGRSAWITFWKVGAPIEKSKKSNPERSS